MADPSPNPRLGRFVETPVGNEDAAWYYPGPSAAAVDIKGRVAFWKGVEVR